MFEKIFNKLNDGIIVFDETKRVSLINLAAKKFFSLNEDILGKRIEEFVGFPRLQNIFFVLGKELKEVFRKEIRLEEDLILELTSIPLIEKEKRISTIVVLHDITREKTVDKLKSEFLSISAHQMRTPLASLKWSLETILKSKSDTFDDIKRQIIKKALEAVERMLSLVNELLDVAAIEEGRCIYKMVPTDFEELVISTINIFEDKIKEKEIQFEFQAPAKKLPRIKIDPKRMSLVLQNLLDNAIRYNYIGGRIKISLEAKEGEIEFKISDSGIGIPQEQQRNIFQKFFRAENALKRETEGSGIGLYVAKNIVQAHGGKIWFESKEGEGTTFYVHLPIK